MKSFLQQFSVFCNDVNKSIHSWLQCMKADESTWDKVAKNGHVAISVFDGDG